jgi:hypothetical protein
MDGETPFFFTISGCADRHASIFVVMCAATSACASRILRDLWVAGYPYRGRAERVPDYPSGLGLIEHPEYPEYPRLPSQKHLLLVVQTKCFGHLHCNDLPRNYSRL